MYESAEVRDFFLAVKRNRIQYLDKKMNFLLVRIFTSSSTYSDINLF